MFPSPVNHEFGHAASQVDRLLVVIIHCCVVGSQSAVLKYGKQTEAL